MRRPLLIILWSQVLMPSIVVNAQFGIGNRKNMEQQQQQQQQELQQQEQGEILNNLENDPELLAAMEIFAGMSAEEMRETMKELTNMLGDDPETKAAIQEVMDEISKLKASDIQSTLKQMVTDDEIAVATQEALRMLGKSNWATIWEKQDVILEAVIQSGQMTAEDAALFKSDNEAWEKELRFIWNELQKQAAVVNDEL